MKTAKTSTKKEKIQIDGTKPDACCADRLSTKKKSVIKVHFDCGFLNSLFIRGEGIPGLSWDKGILLQNKGKDEWVWETTACFNAPISFKILINDTNFENGENHLLKCGSTVSCTPNF